MPSRREQVRDPLLRRFTSGAAPPLDTLLKGGAPRVEQAPETQRISVRRALRTLGPGLVTGASDADPGGIGTYSQAGSQFGFGLLWTSFFTYPLMLGVQEMCGRIALVTGQGMGAVLRRRFATWVVAPCILLLVVANVFNAGADLGAIAAGLSLLAGGRIGGSLLVVPIGLGLLGAQMLLRYEQVASIFKWLTLALFAYLIAAVLARPNPVEVLRAAVIPHVELNATFIADLVAVFGTTITPYLFFWQASSEVEHEQSQGMDTKGARRAALGPRRLRWSRFDIVVGTLVAQVVMFAILLTTGSVLHDHGVHSIQSASDAAKALQPVSGIYAGVIFAIGIIGAGVLAVPILCATGAYAIKEFTGWGGSLGLRPRYRPTFYLVLAAAMVVAIGLNFIGLNPIHFLVLSAAVNGVVAPPLLVLITLSAADEGLMRDRRSGRLSLAVCWTATALMTVAAGALLLTTFIH